MFKNKDKLVMLKADLSLIFIVMIWGTTFPLMKIALGNVKPFYFISLRFITAFIVLTLILNKRLKKINLKTIKIGTFLGLWLFLGYAFQIYGLQFTTASRSGFITGLSVIVVPILSIFILKEIPSLSSWGGVFLALVGMYFLTGFTEAGFNYGDLLTFFCAVSIALQIVFLSKYIKNEDPLVITWLQITTVMVLGTVISFFESSAAAPINSNSIAVIIYTGIFATALAIFVQSRAQQFTTSTHTGLIFSLEPVFGALFSFMILSERMQTMGMIGAVLIFLGILLSELGDKKVGEKSD
ncbi:MAG: DMT family transporter [Halanaerobiales bacterium]|nr:DMT family transporter [Halanaerobiales bacterium]